MRLADILHPYSCHDAYTQQLQIFLHDPSRSRALALNGDKYAVAALHCLNFLCDDNLGISSTNDARHPWRWRLWGSQKGFRTYERKYIKRRDLYRNRPWFWRKLMRSSTKLSKGNSMHWDYYRTISSFASREAADRFFHSRAFRWALRCFCRLLNRSARSEELLQSVSRRSFASRSQDWPHEARLAREAIIRYINTWVVGRPCALVHLCCVVM